GCIRGCDDLINEFFNVRAASTTTADQQHSNRGSSLLVSRRSSPSPQHTLVQASPTPLFPGNQEAVALSGNPACRCGMPSAQRVTAADGPNRGRPFYVCSKARESQCGFFEWADQQQPPQQQPLQNRRQEMPLYGQQPLPSVYSSTDDGASPVAKPKCKCGYFAAIKTKQAGGANQGREYYMCTRAFNGCGFVCWADEAEAYMARPPVASGSAAPTASTCYSCGQSGHWARDCPRGAQASGAFSASFLSRPPERPAPSAPARRGRASRGGGGGRARTRRGGSARGRGSRSSGRGRGAALSSGIGGSGGPGFMDTVDHSSGGGGFDFWS
ncbi:DNA topoisomerase, partial [Coemansia sp. RSA 1933]